MKFKLFLPILKLHWRQVLFKNIVIVQTVFPTLGQVFQMSIKIELNDWDFGEPKKLFRKIKWLNQK